eukprot:5124601-Lingulodinium_polyedra.AAC.1
MRRFAGVRVRCVRPGSTRARVGLVAFATRVCVRGARCDVLRECVCGVCRHGAQTCSPMRSADRRGGE